MVLQSLKVNCIVLNGEVEEKICKYLTCQFDGKNSEKNHRLIKLFKYSGPEKFILRYLECCLSLVTENRNLLNLSLKHFKILKSHTTLAERRFSPVVSLKEEVFVFGGCGAEKEQIMCVEKHSPSSNSWKQVTSLYDDRKYFTFCCFTDHVFMIGGLNNGITLTDSCVAYSAQGNVWKEVASLNEGRTRAGAAVFQGKIVVSGGWNGVASPNRSSGNDLMNTVEALDFASGAWYFLPNMVERRCWHGSVAAKNKLFVIGGANKPSSEVYDGRCGKFVALIDTPHMLRRKKYLLPVKTFLVGSKIFVLDKHEGYVACYDVDRNEWSEKPCKAGISLNALGF